MTKKILTIIGARPQFVKAAVITRLFKKDDSFTEIMVHTGQHFDEKMSDVFFRELDIPKPKYFLNVNSLNHGAMTGRMLEQIEQIIENERPDIVLVYGDTNSTLAGALAASKLHVPIAHVEAGLRSFNKKMPEEINRVLVDHMSDLLFSPTKQAVKNLHDENIRKSVSHVGDVMYDATLFAKSKVSELTLSNFGLQKEKYAILTVHRQENSKNIESIQEILEYVKKYAISHSISVIWPIHPRIKGMLSSLDYSGVDVVDPIGYQEMQDLIHFSHTILTDSGGLQKEAYFHQKLCITLRDETEWGETVECGWNRLWKGLEYCEPKRDISDYGDGHSGEVIVEQIRQFLG